MGMTTGVQPIVNYATPVGDPAKVQALLDLIPDPATTSSSGAVAGGANGTLNTYLDEMSAMCMAQLRVELIALKAAVS